MANYAKIVDGKVENVIVAEQEWVATQTQDVYVLSTEENVAYIDGTIVDGIFIGPQPFPSWILSNDNKWYAPIPLPSDSDTVVYRWNEETLSWVEMQFN